VQDDKIIVVIKTRMKQISGSDPPGRYKNGFFMVWQFMFP